MELEKRGIPVAFVSAVPAIPLSLGVSRVVLGVAIVHPLGDRELPPERERRLRRALVETALGTLGQEVSRPTLFRAGSAGLAPRTATPFPRPAPDPAASAESKVGGGLERNP